MGCIEEDVSYESPALIYISGSTVLFLLLSYTSNVLVSNWSWTVTGQTVLHSVCIIVWMLHFINRHIPDAWFGWLLLLLSGLNFILYIFAGDWSRGNLFHTTITTRIWCRRPRPLYFLHCKVLAEWNTFISRGCHLQLFEPMKKSMSCIYTYFICMLYIWYWFLIHVYHIWHSIKDMHIRNCFYGPFPSTILNLFVC